MTLTLIMFTYKFYNFPKFRQKFPFFTFPQNIIVIIIMIGIHFSIQYFFLNGPGQGPNHEPKALEGCFV